MRILFVSSSSGSHGGGEISLLPLGRALVARGNQVALWTSTHSRMDPLCGDFGAFGEVFRSDYTNTYDRRLRGLWNPVTPGRATEWAASWREWKPDVIHLNKQNLEDGLDLLSWIDALEMPAVCMIHITQAPSRLRAIFGRLRDFIARRQLSRYRGVVLVNPSRIIDLRAFASLRREPVAIDNGVVVPSVETIARLRQETRQRLGIGPQEKLILGVGRFVAQKRPLLFLEEAIRVKAVVPEARFLWIGAAPKQSFAWVGDQTQFNGRSIEQEWDGRVADAGLGSSIEILGWQKEVLPYLAAADFYFHTAGYEGQPFALLEAMATGVPVGVSADLADDLSFLDASNSMRLGEVSDWNGLLRDSLRLAKIGQTGRMLIERDYSIARAAATHERLYETLIGQHRAAF